MKRIQELQEELRKLQQEVRPGLASNPQIQERRREMEKPRARLMEIHKARNEMEIQIKKLNEELKTFQKPEKQPAL